MADADELLVQLGDDDKARKENALTKFRGQMAALNAARMSAAEWHESMVSTRNRLI